MIVAPSITVASVAVSIKRRAVYVPRRIKSPPEGAIENSVSWNKRESVEPRVPIPTRAPPARSPRTPSARRVDPSRIHVRFCHITRSQTAPAIQTPILTRFLVEFLVFERAVRRKIQLASGLYLNLFLPPLYHALPSTSPPPPHTP